jgi:hypothetical protein
MKSAGIGLNIVLDGREVMQKGNCERKSQHVFCQPPLGFQTAATSQTTQNILKVGFKPLRMATQSSFLERVANRRCVSGAGLLDHCVVKIEFANKSHGGVVWKHPTYCVKGDQQ